MDKMMKTTVLIAISVAALIAVPAMACQNDTGQDSLAPDPGHLAVLVEKIKKMSTTNTDWNYKQEVKSITAPSLLIFGDAEIVRPEHAIKFYQLLGGGRLSNSGATP